MMNLRDLLVNEPDHRPVDPGAVSTGFLDLDTSVGGWHLGDLILVADGDQDGHMASVLACHFALTAAAQGRIPTGVVSLTTSEIQLSLELLAVHAGQDRSSVRRKMAYDAHLSRAAHHLGQLPITVRSLTAADLEELELEDAILELKHDHRCQRVRDGPDWDSITAGWDVTIELVSLTPTLTLDSATTDALLPCPADHPPGDS